MHDDAASTAIWSFTVGLILPAMKRTQQRSALRDESHVLVLFIRHPGISWSD